MIKPQNKIILTFLLIVFILKANAINIPFTIVSDHDIKSVLITNIQANKPTSISSFNINVLEFAKQEINIIAIGNEMRLVKQDTIIGDYKRLLLSPSGSDLKINILGNHASTLSYNGILQLTNKDGVLLLEAITNIEYLSWIKSLQVKSQYDLSKEIIPLINIIERTKLLLLKDNKEMGQKGFSIHIQDFINASSIEQYAGTRTDSRILCDTNNNIVSCPYHISCGGKTISSEDAWGIPIYYLHEVIDPFCISDYLQKDIIGHRVGICLKGAENQLKAGKSFEEIISFYTPMLRIIEKNSIQKE